MSTTTCKTCSGTVASSAPFCPHCGADRRHGIILKGNSLAAQGCDGCLFLLLVLAGLIVYLMIRGGG